jgi:hypothetical protein
VIVKESEAKMGGGIVERLRVERLEICDRVLTSEVAQAFHEFVTSVQMVPVGVEELARDPHGPMAVQEAREMIRPTSLVRQDDEPISVVHSIHEVSRLDSTAFMSLRLGRWVAMPAIATECSSGSFAAVGR